MFNAGHLDVHCSLTGQPSSSRSSGGGRDMRPDPEFLNEGERVDVLPAPFLLCGKTHVKQNINHTRVFLHTLKLWRGTLKEVTDFSLSSKILYSIHF